MCYFGSTTKERLCQRMVDHRTKYNCWRNGKTNKCTVFDNFDNYGIENCRIVLVETYPCNNRDELTAKEGEYIVATQCLNKRIEGRPKNSIYLITI